EVDRAGMARPAGPRAGGLEDIAVHILNPATFAQHRVTVAAPEEVAKRLLTVGAGALAARMGVLHHEAVEAGVDARLDHCLERRPPLRVVHAAAIAGPVGVAVAEQ